MLEEVSFLNAHLLRDLKLIIVDNSEDNCYVNDGNAEDCYFNDGKAEVVTLPTANEQMKQREL